MEELLVTKNLAYAAKTGGGTIAGITEIELLAIGAIAIFSAENNTLITSTTDADVLNSFKQFRFALGMEDPKKGTQQVYWSQPFGLVDRTASPLVTDYSAPTKQVSYLGNNTSSGSLNLPGTLEVGSLAMISIIQKEYNSPFERTKINIEYLVKTGDTATNVVNGLVTKLNSRAGDIIVASAVSTNQGIKLEAVDLAKPFEITFDGILANASFSTTVTPKAGSGVPTNLIELENSLLVNRGFHNKVMLPQLHFAYKTNIDTTATYDVFAIKTSALHSVSAKSKFTQDKTILVANHKSATAAKATLISLLQLIFNNIVVVEEE